MKRSAGTIVWTSLLVLLVALGASAQEKVRLWPHTRQEFIEVAEAFKAAHPEIEVLIEPGSVGDNDRLGTAIAAGVGPDVYATSRTDRYFLGWVTPLNDYFEKSELAKAYLNGGTLGAWVLQQAIESYSYKGQILALPNGWSYPVLGLYQNRDMFEASGIPVFGPNVAPTWEEVAEVHRKLTRVSGDGRIEQLGFPAHAVQLTPANLARAFGRPILDADGNLDIEGLVLGYTFMREQFIPPLDYQAIAAYLGSDAGDQLPVVSGKAAMALAPARGPNELGGLDLALSYAPHIDGRRIAYIGGIFYQLGRPLANPDAAYRFLDFTFAYMPFHEKSLLQNGRMGAAGFDRVVELTAMIEESNPAAAWFIWSMAEADELSFAEMAPWIPDFDQVMAENERVIRLWDGRAPIRPTLEEVQRIVNARFAQSPWFNP